MLRSHKTRIRGVRMFLAMRRTLDAVACLTLLLTFAVVEPSAGRAQVPPEVRERIDSLFAPWEVHGSPGAAVGVVRGGRLIFANGYGDAQIEFGVPITAATPFHAASEAKQFTATAVLILAERGLVSVDDDIRRHLPEMPDFGPPVTIRHLLNHSSGLRDQWQILALAGRRGWDLITTGHVLRMVQRQRALNFLPGHAELYCNTGYTLLAEIVARVSGKSFREFTREEIFEPLGMRNTEFLDDAVEPIPGRAYSYAVNVENGGFDRRILNYAVPGATSLWTTVEDLAKWLANLEEPVVGTADLYARLHAPDTLVDGSEVVWGYGMTAGEYRGFTRYGHGGGDAGFRAYSVRFPGVDLAVVVLANLSAINPGPFGDDALALQVADLFLPADTSAAHTERAPSPDQPAPVDAMRYVGTYEDAAGRAINIVNEFGTLQLWDLASGEATSLRMVSGTNFQAAGDSIDRVSFEVQDGRVRRLIVSGRENATWVGERVGPVPPEGLTVFAGRYYSDELETTWTLSVEDEALTARHLMNDDIVLTPVVRDLFDGDAWFLGEVRFLRDSERRVTGMLVSAGRIKDVRFRRLDL